MKQIRVCLAAIILGAFSDVRANVVVGNLTQPGGWLGNNIYVGASWSHAVSVTTGGSSFSVENVKFRLYTWPTENNAAGTQVGFYTDNSGQPGTLVGSIFTNPTFTPGEDANSTFTPTTGLTLNPNTTYWVKLYNPYENPNPQNINMYFYPDTTPSTSDGWTYNGMASGSGVSWSANFYAVPAFEISATAVPEPRETAMLFGLGLCAFAGWLRRFKARTRV